MKRFFPGLILCFTLAGATGPITLSATLKRTSLDLLEGINITIAVDNHAKKIVTTTYSDADTYDIRILDAHRKTVWAWSDAHKAAPVRKTLTFSPGRNVLVVHIWDETLAGGRSIAPGVYSIHANLSDEQYRPTVEIPVRFAAPVPIAAALKLPADSAVTISGTLRVAGTGVEIADPSGALKLNRRIAMQAPQGQFIVRGYLTKANGETFFTVDRWARAYDNVAPPPTNSPAPLPVGPRPHPTRTPR